MQLNEISQNVYCKRVTRFISSCKCNDIFITPSQLTTVITRFNSDRRYSKQSLELRSIRKRTASVNFLYEFLASLGVLVHIKTIIVARTKHFF